MGDEKQTRGQFAADYKAEVKKQHLVSGEAVSAFDCGTPKFVICYQLGT